MNNKIVAAVAVSVMLSACCNGDSPPPVDAVSAPASAPAGGGAPVSVSTVIAQQRDYAGELETTGTVTALNLVEIKPLVSSTISQVHIREGQFVKAGQLLFTLDARTEETNVAKAQAQLQKDLASLADAQRQLARSKELGCHRQFVRARHAHDMQNLLFHTRSAQLFHHLLEQRIGQTRIKAGCDDTDRERRSVDGQQLWRVETHG